MIKLKSAKGVDYSKLEQLLKQEKWKEADQETLRVMLQAANRVEQGWLECDDLKNFPYEDLCTINHLWIKYSNGKFGFSVQKDIWLEVGEKSGYDGEEKLGDPVGWRKRGDWLSYDFLTFNLSLAPKGHLPIKYAGRILIDNETCKPITHQSYGRERVFNGVDTEERFVIERCYYWNFRCSLLKYMQFDELEDDLRNDVIILDPDVKKYCNRSGG